MSDWDASDNESAPAVKAPIVHKKTKWDEEEEEDNVALQEEWDVSEDESPAPTPAVPVAGPRKKGTLKQKIAEKEAAKAARLAAGLDSDEAEDDSELDVATKRRLDRERELAADLKNARDLLGGAALNGNGSPAAVPSELEEIVKANPKTKEEFQQLSTLIYERLIKPHQSKPLFASFVELHVRELAQTLKDVDVRRAASALTTLANEKQKEKTQAGKKKGKAATKPVLGAAKAINKIDTSAYVESLDDFGKETDDFM